MLSPLRYFNILNNQNSKFISKKIKRIFCSTFQPPNQIHFNRNFIVDPEKVELEENSKNKLM